MKYYLTVTIILLLSCHAMNKNTATTEIQLTALSPYQYEFKDNADTTAVNRLDYYFTENKFIPEKDFVKKLDEAVKNIAAKNAAKFKNYSVYVYEKTDKLNADFKGTKDDLHGVYDSSIVSYSRFVYGKPDIFYGIKDGNVVYDLIEKKEVSPSWEFD